MKIIYLLTINFFYATFLSGQVKSNIIATCDTFTIKGYAVYLTEFCEKNKTYDVYFGFCYYDIAKANSILSSSLSTYTSFNFNDPKSIGSLINIPRKQFRIIKNNLDEALIEDVPIAYTVISSICDTVKRNYFFNCLWGNSVENKLFELPNVQSYSVQKKVTVNKLKLMVSVRPMELRCIEIIYPSFKTYYDMNLRPEIFSHSLSFSGKDKDLRIKIREIKKANKKDGKYHLIVPIYRID